MKTMSNELEIISAGRSDQFDFLNAEELDLIQGGDTSCQKGYSSTDKQTKCSCGYKITFETAENQLEP